MDHTPRHAAVPASPTFSSVVRVTRPAAGESQYIASAAGAQIYLDFDRQGVDFERTGTHLLIKFDDGSSVTLVNFFAVGDRPLPTFHSAEGEPISAAEFLSAYIPDFDYSPAPAGSGTLYEAAKAGELEKGIERLGSLEAAYWNHSAEAGSTLYSTLPADETRPFGGMGSTSAGPVGPAGSTFPLHIMAQSRAVAYLGSEGEDPTAGEYPYTLRHAFAPSLAGPNLTRNYYIGADPVLEACSAGDGDFFTAVWESGDGAFHITLTEAGKQWLAINTGQDLVGYFRIDAPNHPGGSYVLQTVFTSSDTFHSTTTPLNAYYDTDASVFGETHHGVNPNKGTGYDVTASDKPDNLGFVGPVVDAGLDTGMGDDFLSITGVVENSDVSMGPGRDAAWIGGQLIVNSGTHTVTMDEGNLGVYAQDVAAGTAVSVEGAELNVAGNAAYIVFSTISTDGVSAGINAAAGGKVRVAGSGVTIDAETYGGDGGSAGVVVNDNSDGVINASEYVFVHADNYGTGSAYAAQATGGSGLTMSGAGVRLAASSAARFAGAAVATGTDSRLAVTSSEYLHMKASGELTTYGVLAAGGAAVTVDADGDDAHLSVSVISESGTGYGLCSNNAGSELTVSSTGTADVSVTGTRAYALSSFAGTAEVTAARHLELNATSTKGAYGIYATGPLMKVDVGSLNVSANNTDGGAGNRAIYAGSGSEVLIGTNSLNITSTANGGIQTEGLSAMNQGSRVEINLKESDTGTAQAFITTSSMNIPASSPSYRLTTGIGTQNGNIVLRGAQESANTIEITSQADGGDVFGIRSYQAAQPVPTSVDILGGDLADSISITATGTGNTKAYGIYSARYTNIPNDATLTIDGGAGADTITISATSENREARACTASTRGNIAIAGGEGSLISIFAESIANQAWGLSGQGGISLTGSRIDIQAHAHGAYMGAYAVQAWDPEQDVLIKGHESGLHLTISATGAAGSRAIYTSDLGSHAIIEGSDTAGDTITITGDVYSMSDPYNKPAIGYGNQIHTHGGNDGVDITGTTYRTHINLGEGDDTLTLRHNPLTTDPDRVVSYSLLEGGAGFDVLNLDAFAPGGAFTLGNLIGYTMPGSTGGAISGFEQINLAGFNANTLDLNLADLIAWNDGLDSLLENLSHSSGTDLTGELSANKYLVVTGTGSDTVKLEDGITDTGSEVTDGTSLYNVYSCEDNLETYYLLILQSVVVA